MRERLEDKIKKNQEHYKKLIEQYNFGVEQENNARIDSALMQGVRAHESFSSFQRKTQCPESLAERYNLLLTEYEKTNPDPRDPFLQGFNTTY